MKKRFFKPSNFEKYYKDLVPLMKKEDNQKYFLIILSLSASIFFFLFAINPTLSTIAKLKKQITDATLVEAQLSEKINNLSLLSQEYQTIQQDLPIILDAVPREPQVPTLVGQIQSLGSESSVQIGNIEVMPVNLTSSNATSSASVFFTITANSSFENMQIFIDNLINMQRVISINAIQTTKSTEDESYDFIIKGGAYYKK